MGPQTLSSEKSGGGRLGRGGSRGRRKKSKERWEKTYSGLEIQEDLSKKVIFKNGEEPALGRKGEV